MSISVCITVLNEGSAVGKLLESLIGQTKRADEIVVVDGGSTDKTVEIIKHFAKKNKTIKFTVEKGGIAHGRNTAIELAKGEIIAQTDGGCVAKSDWLEKLTRPFAHKGVGLVAGFYEMPYTNSFQEALNVFHGVSPARFDPVSFLPSARSVAFRRQLWEKVGGYAEHMPGAGEDTLFFYKCVKTGVRIARVEEAKVTWWETTRLTFKSSMKKFFNYAKGDAKAGIWWHPVQQFASHNINIILIFLRFILGLVVLIYSFENPLLTYVLLI